jgi:hypothetical protein
MKRGGQSSGKKLPVEFCWSKRNPNPNLDRSAREADQAWAQD